MKFLILLLLTSCASSSVVLKKNDLLPYKESSQITKFEGGSLPLKIVKVDDKRKASSFGYAFTGVQYTKTPVYMDTDIQKWITQFFNDAFALRNISVIDSSDALPMEIEVNHVWVEEVIEEFQPEKARCNVDLSFHIKNPKKKWSGRYWTEFTSGGDMSDGTERLSPTLASCMNELVEKLVNDSKFVKIIQ